LSGRIIYTCPFVPAEWIAAHGMSPSRMMPDSRSLSNVVGATAGLCSFARAFINTVISDKDAVAIVATTLCDQMRRASELISTHTDRPVYLMNVPHTWMSSNARDLYLDEIRRLGAFLVRLGGVSPSRGTLVETMKAYEGARAAIRGALGRVSSRRYAEMIADFHQAPRPNDPPTLSAPRSVGIPLALVGGPLLSDYMDVYDLIEGSRGYVALDATETGERGMPAPVESDRLRDDPLNALGEAYFGGIPDPARRPDSMLYQWLEQRIADRGIRGIILLRHLWCDNWHAEAERLKVHFGLPFLHLDMAGQGTDSSRSLTRLQAFMEMLR
jgi:benzoyl-CoA reductase/2-hydroxyglutaryl-CoA dehydratase subunit BcrC/BadD/HgdB